MNMDMSGFEQCVRERAYYLWESEGRPMGRHVEHWLGAEDAERAEREASDAETCAPQALIPEEATAQSPPPAPKPAKAKKAAAPKAKAAAPKKKAPVTARRGATVQELTMTLQ